MTSTATEVCRARCRDFASSGVSAAAGQDGWESPPTAELHVHVEGTLEPAAVIAMAARNGVSIPVTDPVELLARYSFSDLQSFLDLHYANLSVLRTGQDFFDLATSYLDQARRWQRAAG